MFMVVPGEASYKPRRDTEEGRHKMKRIANAHTFLATVFSILLVYPLACKKEEPKAKEIKIGAILPLTGDLATYGENAKNGAILLSEEVNARGGLEGKRVALVFEDSRAQPDQGVAAFQKLMNVDNVLGVIGEVASSPLLAISPIANQNRIVVVSPAASSPDITNAGPYIYRVWPSDVFEADRMADYVKKQGIRTVASLYVNNDYGRALMYEFTKRLEGSNVVIASEEQFDQNTTDVRTQLARLKKSNPDCLYLISYPKESVVILRQYKEMGLKSMLLSTSSFEDPLITKETGSIAEGAVFTSPIPPDDTDPIVSAFRKNYEERFGKRPGLVADYGYDALKVMLEALDLSGEMSREGLSRGMEMIKDLRGATGLINFDENGDVIKLAGIKTIKDGKYVWLESQR